MDLSFPGPDLSSLTARPCLDSALQIAPNPDCEKRYWGEPDFEHSLWNYSSIRREFIWRRGALTPSWAAWCVCFHVFSRLTHSPASSAPNEHSLFAVQAFHTSRSHLFKRCSGVIIKSFYSCMPRTCDSSFHTSLPSSSTFLPLPIILSFHPAASPCPPFLRPASLAAAALSVALPETPAQWAVMFQWMPRVCLCVAVCVCVSLCVTGSCRKLGWLTLMATRCLTLRYGNTHKDTHFTKHTHTHTDFNPEDRRRQTAEQHGDKVSDSDRAKGKGD